MSGLVPAPATPRRKSPRDRLLPFVAVLAVALAAFVLWFVGARLQDLDRQLKSAEQKAAEVNRRLGDYSREVNLAIQRAERARQEAAEAHETADEAVAARLDAEADSAQAQRQAEAALAYSEQARSELDLIRQRREQELDRMQKALNLIAPTRRTPSGMVMELAEESFKFDFDSAALRLDNRETLSRIAGVLLASEGYRLFIDGHTDDIGTVDYNQGLSERRARSVRDYLVKAGIPDEIISVRGFGKSTPRAAGKTAAARQKNRRVEIGIVDTIVHYGDKVGSPE